MDEASEVEVVGTPKRSKSPRVFDTDSSDNKAEDNADTAPEVIIDKVHFKRRLSRQLAWWKSYCETEFDVHADDVRVVVPRVVTPTEESFVEEEEEATESLNSPVAIDPRSVTPEGSVLVRIYPLASHAFALLLIVIDVEFQFVLSPLIVSKGTKVLSQTEHRNNFFLYKGAFMVITGNCFTSCLFSP